MSELGARHHVAVSNVGKYKNLQITALIMMLYQHDMLILPMYDLGYGFLLASAILTLWSMAQYMVSAWPASRRRYLRVSDRGSSGPSAARPNSRRP